MVRLNTLEIIDSCLRLDRIIQIQNDEDLLEEDLEYKQNFTNMVHSLKQEIEEDDDFHLLDIESGYKLIYDEFIEELQQRERN
jgi:hypothetical protein